MTTTTTTRRSMKVHPLKMQYTEHEEYQIHLWHLAKDNEERLYNRWIELAREFTAGKLTIDVQPSGALTFDKPYKVINLIRHIQFRAPDKIRLNKWTRRRIMHELAEELLETDWGWTVKEA